MSGAVVAVGMAGSLVVLEQPAAAHGTCRSGGERVYGLTASARVRCATARQVAAAYDTAVMGDGTWPSGRIPAARYTCRTTPAGSAESESFTVRCVRGSNVVRFGWGV